MKTTLNTLVGSAVLLGAIMLPIAVNASQPYGVNARLHNQARRVDAGVADHQLNLRQEYSLDARDSRIRTIEDRDRSRDDGSLTARQRTNLEHDLNRTSRTIYRERH